MAPVTTDTLDDRATHQAAAPPMPRGPVSELLLASLRERPHEISWSPASAGGAEGDDLQLALYCCYELHYQGLPGVAETWEWEPSLLAIRRQLEDRFLAELQDVIGPVEATAGTVVPRLREMAADSGGPSLSAWVSETATIEQLRELVILRSAYQLKEADPHTWGIPRLAGAAKAAMVSIQFEEYGEGVAERMHSALFSDTMRAVGLDPATSYLDAIPGVALATTNLISLLGLHRRWRGALVGHLALFEMTSVGPMGRYGHAMRRLGVPEEACRFYDVHVVADESHQDVATDGMVGGLLAREPDLARDVVFGAMALQRVEERFASYVLGCWQAGRSSLRRLDWRAGEPQAPGSRLD